VSTFEELLEREKERKKERKEKPDIPAVGDPSH
jgi:hypothetical protein